jgi:hypothetical protein
VKIVGWDDCNTLVVIFDVHYIFVVIMNYCMPSDVICKHCTLKNKKMEYVICYRKVRTRVMGVGGMIPQERGIIGVLRVFHIP